jgi:hypothetical protein
VSTASRLGPYRRAYRSPWVASPMHVEALLAAVAVLTFGGFLAGRGLAPARAPDNPVADAGGIPVGVERSPSGALAAADSYVALSYDTVERDPGRDTQLIDTAYAPSIRAGAISGAAAVRSQNRAGMRLWAQGGQNLSLIGARRLDYYRGDSAQVTAWNADIFWGPGRAPKQGWVLTQISLRWSGARWLVTETSTLPTPGPVPAVTPQASARNDSVAAFDTALRGFTAPTYGGVG